MVHLRGFVDPRRVAREGVVEDVAEIETDRRVEARREAERAGAVRFRPRTGRVRPTSPGWAARALRGKIPRRALLAHMWSEPSGGIQHELERIFDPPFKMELSSRFSPLELGHHWNRQEISVICTARHEIVNQCLIKNNE